MLLPATSQGFHWTRCQGHWCMTFNFDTQIRNLQCQMGHSGVTSVTFSTKFDFALVYYGTKDVILEWLIIYFGRPCLKLSTITKQKTVFFVFRGEISKIVIVTRVTATLNKILMLHVLYPSWFLDFTKTV